VRRPALFLFLFLAAVALAGCGGNETATPETTDSGGVEELANVLDLRGAFEADAGKTRVVLLLSPT
jgi:ABC-type glycerol-3-phosphate transport system substrate-binding protein